MVLYMFTIIVRMHYAALRHALLKYFEDYKHGWVNTTAALWKSWVCNPILLHLSITYFVCQILHNTHTVLYNLPSVSVALSSILKNFVFQDELLTSSPFITGFVRPVPNETTHWIGKPGHNCLASWIATAVGLFTKRPPSWNEESNTI
jgi:hypothetical protein